MTLTDDRVLLNNSWYLRMNAVLIVICEDVKLTLAFDSQRRPHVNCSHFS